MNQHTSGRFFFNVDWVTVLVYVALCIIGWVNIYSAVPNKTDTFSFAASYGRQLIFMVGALVIGFSILLFEARFFSVFAPVIYGITVIMLAAILLIGNKVAGNQAWFAIGSFKLQPSEFAKFGTALLLARYVGSFNPKFRDLKSIGTAAVIVIIPLALIMLQPDYGSALVFLSFMFPLYREGLSGYFLLLLLGMITLFVAAFLVPFKILIPVIIAIAAIFVYFQRKKQKTLITIALIAMVSIGYLFLVKATYNSILAPHQRARIELILGLKTDNRGVGYNVLQSKIAIGSGQFTGRGFLNGTQTKFNYVPEQSTDFIFSTVGEEWGFIGCFVVIGLYMFLLLRIINLAERQRSAFSRVYGYCVASIIFFHVFINIGMTIGIVPVIGIPLPFISYGGSSLWSFTTLLFIFLKLDSNRMGFM